MNIKMISLLSTLVLVTTACGPKQDDATNPPQHVTVAPASAAAAQDEEIKAAKESKDAATSSTADLVNSYWKLIELNNSKTTVSDNQREPHIVLDAENRVSGSDGCNRLMGSYTLDGNKLTLGQMAGTKMACTDGMEQSAAFNEALTKVAIYSLQGDQLDLQDNSGQVIARFKSVALP